MVSSNSLPNSSTNSHVLAELKKLTARLEKGAERSKELLELLDSAEKTVKAKKNGHVVSIKL